MKFRVILVLAILGCMFTSASAEYSDAVRRSASQYVESRQAGGKRFVLNAEQAAAQLRSAAKPVILDLRPASDFSRVRLKDSQRCSLTELLTPDSLARLPENRPILVLGDGSYESVEAMVLLRLLGRQVFAVRESVESVIQQVAAAARTKPDAGAGLNDVVEGPETEATAQYPIVPNNDNPAGNANVPEPPPLPLWAFGVIGGLVLIISGGFLWFAFLQPRRKARPLLDAIELLSSGGDAALAKAEKLLNQAVNAGLKPEYQSEARFLLAYVKARLGRYADALLVLKDSEDSSLETLYLQLWLNLKEKHWDDADRLCYNHSSEFAGFLKGKELVGIVYLELARQAMARNQYERALDCFQKVKELGVFRDQVPEHLADLEMVLAMNVLFEDKEKANLAHERFEAARKSAEASGHSSLLPRIGMLLCEWRQHDRPNIDSQLGSILEEVKAASAKENDHAEVAKMLPSIALWYAVSLFYQWFRRLPEKNGLPPQERKALEQRLDVVREAMPKDGDAGAKPSTSTSPFRRFCTWCNAKTGWQS